eukprot:755358-Hanusia_phi.AAC.2
MLLSLPALNSISTSYSLQSSPAMQDFVRQADNVSSPPPPLHLWSHGHKLTYPQALSSLPWERRRSGNAVLALQLIFHRNLGGTSEFKPYVDLLPAYDDYVQACSCSARLLLTSCQGDGMDVVEGTAAKPAVGMYCEHTKLQWSSGNSLLKGENGMGGQHRLRLRKLQVGASHNHLASVFLGSRRRQLLSARSTSTVGSLVRYGESLSGE